VDLPSTRRIAGGGRASWVIPSHGISVIELWGHPLLHIVFKFFKILTPMGPYLYAGLAQIDAEPVRVPGVVLHELL